MKTIAIIQARMGSKRFPKKMTAEIGKTPLIAHVIRRVRKSGLVDKIVLATSTKPENQELLDIAEKEGIEGYAGSEDDVLDRFYQAAKKYGAEEIVRITGDCPLLDPKIIDAVIEKFRQSDADYASNILPPTYPDGLDVEVFSFNALEKTWKNTKLKSEREHVTAYITEEKGDFKTVNVENEEDLSKIRLTVDEKEDLEAIKRIAEKLGNEDFHLVDIMEILEKHPEIMDINKKYERNEGYARSLKEDKEMINIKNNSGIKLWNKAKKLIPGGTQLLSKRSELFLPEYWPSYFRKAKGIDIEDLDGNKYKDFSSMGVGSCLLGYADDDVNRAVKKVVEAGSMSTLNSPEEVELAEMLLEIHPWAQQVRYARTGGEAMAVAVRIARAHSEEEKVALCGYHGWHDWYLSCNLSDDSNLDGHLLPGLKPKGVPRGLLESAIPFEYNDIQKLEEIVKKNDIGVIIVEPLRHQEPKEGFLEKVREIADKIGAVLIFDEITSGWRNNIGGVHLTYGVYPDIVVYAKGMSNGYPMAVIVGKREVMDAAQDTFISSTYWTERVGPAAAIATINKLKKENVPQKINEIGGMIGKGWETIAKETGIDIETIGPNSLITFSFKKGNEKALNTLFTQEMLKRGYLASNSVYVSYSHSQEEVEKYLEVVREVFGKIKEYSDAGNVEEMLHGPVAHDGFKRLT